MSKYDKRHWSYISCEYVKEWSRLELTTFCSWNKCVIFKCPERQTSVIEIVATPRCIDYCLLTCTNIASPPCTIWRTNTCNVTQTWSGRSIYIDYSESQPINYLLSNWPIDSEIHIDFPEGQWWTHDSLVSIEVRSSFTNKPYSLPVTCPLIWMLKLLHLGNS